MHIRCSDLMQSVHAYGCFFFFLLLLGFIMGQDVSHILLALDHYYTTLLFYSFTFVNEWNISELIQPYIVDAYYVLFP